MTTFGVVSSWFSTKGRANRRQFWTSFAWLLLAFAIGITAATLFGDNGVYDVPNVPRPLRLALVGAALLPAMILAFRFRSICLRRRRDCRMSETLHAVRWVPFLGRYAHLTALGFLPTREDPLEAASKVFDGPSIAERDANAAAPRGKADWLATRREPTF